MPHTRFNRKILLSLCAAIALLPQAAHGQAACPAQNPIQQTVVHEQAVSINTDILTNTTFYPIPEVAVTVSNAPTSLDGVTTLVWTKTIVQTYIASSRSSVSALATAKADFFFLLQASDLSKHHRRQSGNFYMGQNGTITNDCTTAPVYSVSNAGVLTVTSNGVVYTYSTSAGLAYAPFVASTIPGSIETTFSIGANSVLSWNNPAFSNGQAQFCALSNGTVYAVFQTGSQPNGCLYIQLTLFSGKPCV